MLHVQWSHRVKVALLSGLVLCGLALPRPTAAQDWSLLMVEQAGCTYCARWHADVAPEYPATPEGRFAPLRTVDLRDLPQDVSFDSRPVYTPTFVLVRDGQEVGRLEGYPGEDFFWGLLGHMLTQADATWATQGADG
ncbi:hypothetical protein [Roseicyclus amphidinii]|uniref:hypothetical protein n=1 Tax=Roseicyclus amphidinii TaxID=3034232 RepID=UPI0024E0E62E|nr:hypothetical protein [Roseicyclus sp. Amp-Y-6]